MPSSATARRRLTVLVEIARCRPWAVADVPLRSVDQTRFWHDHPGDRDNAKPARTKPNGRFGNSNAPGPSPITRGGGVPVRTTRQVLRSLQLDHQRRQHASAHDRENNDQCGGWPLTFPRSKPPVLDT